MMLDYNQSYNLVTKSCDTQKLQFNQDKFVTHNYL